MDGGGSAKFEVEEVKRRCDLRTLATAYLGKLKRAGPEKMTACCPFHSEKTPSFYVWRDHFHCFGCGAHGSAIDFLMLVEKLSFAEATRALAARHGIALSGGAQGAPVRALRPEPRQVETRAAPAPPTAEQRDRIGALWRAAHPLKPDDPAWRYLEARGLDVDLLRPWLGGLRCHPALPYRHYSGRHLCTAPAMLGLIQAGDRRPIGLHQTWLGEGGKLQLLDPNDPTLRLPAKKFLGKAQGGAIRFGPPAARLWAGEGIETSLSVLEALLSRGMEGCGLTWSVWALLSLGNWAGQGAQEKRRRPHPSPTDDRKWLPSPIPDPGGAAWRPPVGTREVVFVSDNDAKDPLGAEMLLQRGAARCEAQGVSISIARPPQGEDFNDQWRRKKGGEAA